LGESGKANGDGLSIYIIKVPAMLGDMTPVILTFNEEANIGRVLSKLNWAADIVVVDSFSNDRTLEIIRSFPRTRIFQRHFDCHKNQWNYAISDVCVKTKWVLSLDADYILTDDFISELQSVTDKSDMMAYYVSFKYCVMGKALNNSMLPPRQVLFLRDKSRYITDGHTQMLETEGKSGCFNSYIYHDDRKPLLRWLQDQNKYADLEAGKIIFSSFDQLRMPDKIRKLIFAAPFFAFFYCLFINGNIFNGWAGFYYAFQRMLAEVILSMKIIEKNTSK
jgi:glycosyltransferase involved in cell wall biosynthesis